MAGRTIKVAKASGETRRELKGSSVFCVSTDEFLRLAIALF
jgi:hypothetical protein